MKKYFVLLLLILTSFALRGQQRFRKVYGETGFYDKGNSVCQTPDSGFIVTGRTVNFGAGGSGVDLYLFKTNLKGELVWQKNFGGKGTEEGNSVQNTKDGGYIILGYTNSSGAGANDAYLIKTDNNGIAEWTNTYGGTSIDKGNSVRQTNDGGYIITGETYSFGTGSANAYLVRTNSKGDTLWTRSYGGDGIEEANSVCLSNEGGFVITGKTNSFGAGDYDVYMIYTNDDKTKSWMKTFGGSTSEEGMWIENTSDGGFIITGYTMSFGAGGYDIYLVKTDPDGIKQWAKTFGGTNDDYGKCVKQTADGGYIIAGYTNSYGSGGKDVYLIKTDNIGNLQWDKTFGDGQSDDFGNSIQITKDGGFVIAGSKFSISSSGENNEKVRKVLLLKTDSKGNCE